MVYLVVINTKPGVTLQNVQNALAGLDWYRIAPNAWAVYAPALPWGPYLPPEMKQEDSATITERLSALVKPGGSVLVSKLDLSDHQGLMEQPFWTWINTKPK